VVDAPDRPPPPLPLAGSEPAGRAVVLIDDLVLGSRVRSALSALGVEIDAPPTASAGREALARGASGLILDLDAERLEPFEAIASARAARVPILAYGGHVGVEKLERARQAGADTVVARSGLSSNLVALLEALMTRRGVS